MENIDSVGSRAYESWAAHEQAAAEHDSGLAVGPGPFEPSIPAEQGRVRESPEDYAVRMVNDFQTLAQKPDREQGALELVRGRMVAREILRLHRVLDSEDERRIPEDVVAGARRLLKLS